MLRELLRAGVWLVFSTGLLLAGFAAFGATALVPSVMARGTLPGDLQQQALGALYSALVTQALLPQLLLSGVTCLAVWRVIPALDASRLAHAAALSSAAALWFPVVGHYSFTAWSPTGPRDYLLTLLLVGGGAALALLVPRIVSPALGPGRFTRASKRGMVAAE